MQCLYRDMYLVYGIADGRDMYLITTVLRSACNNNAFMFTARKA